MERNIDANIFMTELSDKNAAVDSISTTVEQTNTATNNGIDVDVLMNNDNNSATVSVTETPSVVTKDRGDGSVPVVEFKNITQIFNKGKENEYKLFENFNLTIDDIPNQGQLVSIMGASGCGKSRLVRALCGLDTVQSGDILVYGKDKNEFGNIPMCFQSYSNYPWLTVIENIMLAMTIHGISKSDAKKRAMELLELVGLKEKANDYPHKLSGGQNQRVSIARCIAASEADKNSSNKKSAQIFVMDEASGALDVKMKKEVQNIILKIFYETELDPTIINITHSIEEALYLSNSVVVLKPNPCGVVKTMNIHYPGEETRQRGEWIFDTPEYAEYFKELSQVMNSLC